MKKLIFFILSVTILFSNDLSKISLTTLFKNHYYSYICLNRWIYINRYLGKREDLLSLVAYSCLKTHKLTFALDLAKALRFTKMGRINSTYIVSLFAIKNYLVRYIEDGFDIKTIKLPLLKGDDLAEVFFMTQRKLPKVSNHSFILKDNNDNLIEVSYSIKRNEISLKFYDKNKNLIRKDIYW